METVEIEWGVSTGQKSCYCGLCVSLHDEARKAGIPVVEQQVASSSSDTTTTTSSGATTKRFVVETLPPTVYKCYLCRALHHAECLQECCRGQSSDRFRRKFEMNKSVPHHFHNDALKQRSTSGNTGSTSAFSNDISSSDSFFEGVDDVDDVQMRPLTHEAAAHYAEMLCQKTSSSSSREDSNLNINLSIENKWEETEQKKKHEKISSKKIMQKPKTTEQNRFVCGQCRLNHLDPFCVAQRKLSKHACVFGPLTSGPTPSGTVTSSGQKGMNDTLLVGNDVVLKVDGIQAQLGKVGFESHIRYWNIEFLDDDDDGDDV